MQNEHELADLMQYSPVPLMLALGVIVLLVTWFSLVFWLTRKKTPKVLATLPVAPPANKDLSALKPIYLQKISDLERRYESREIKARKVHQSLSIILRSFVSEAEATPIITMTLAEIRRTKHTELTPAIESYYRPEFASVETGSVNDAITIARKVVTEWV